MAFLKSKILRRVVLTLILLWATIAFWFLNDIFSVNVIVSVLSVPVLYLIWAEQAPNLILIFISFIAAFALYGFLFYFNLPLWIVMIASVLIYGFLFTYLEQKIGILTEKRLIYLLLFSLLILELFLTLSYFLINPLNRSLIIALSAYLLSGFLLTILPEKPKPINTYIVVYAVMIALLLFSSTWGS